MRRTTAAVGFPWRSHRTVAEQWIAKGNAEEALAALGWLSRQRDLTDPEIDRLKRLVKAAA